MDKNPSYMESIVILAPRELVFGIIEDDDFQKEWMEGYKEIKVLLKTEDLIGTEFEEIININNKEHCFQGRLLKYEKNHILKFSLKEKEIDLKVEYEIERLERNKSVLIIKGWIETSLFTRFFLKYILKERLEKQLSKIKELSENEFKKYKGEILKK